MSRMDQFETYKYTYLFLRKVYLRLAYSDAMVEGVSNVSQNEQEVQALGDFTALMDVDSVDLSEI